MKAENNAPIQVLFVEDSEADFMLLKRRLSQDGLDCSCTRVDQLETLAIALANPPDVILYDYEIPGLNFNEAVALIQTRAEGVPIILVSGTVDEQMATRLLYRGLDDFVLKDNLIRLASSIERALRESFERRGRLAAEEQLRKLARVVEQSPSSILITDTQPAIEYVNEAFVRASGYSREEILGRNPGMLNAGNTPPSTYQALWAALSRGETWRGEFINTRKDDSHYIEAAVVAPIRQPDGLITHYLAIKEDITAQRASEAMIERLAYYDPVTDLANRAMLMKQLELVMASCRQQGIHGAIMVIDIDSFRFINDIHGYEVGDALLRGIGQRLLSCVGEDDTVARLGSDQFAIVLHQLEATDETAIAQACAHATRIHDRLSEPYELDNLKASLRHATSVGVHIFDGQEESAATPLNRAEIALQKAKDDGRNLVRLFSPELKAMVDEHARLEARLRIAIAHRELECHLQSQFDIEGRLLGAEMLLRWPQPDGGFVPPMVFIPLAESTGLILPLGQQVLDQAMAVLVNWAGQQETRQLKLSVNVSARQFHQPDFVEQLQQRIEQHAIDPARLVLELTENVVLDDLETTGKKMRAIRGLGVGLALDDFGKGYSSLSYLKHLPFDQLKIDRSFVADMLSSKGSEAIVRAILAMGLALELQVIAEGVETEAQWEMLRQEHCAGYQGYLFARPVPLSQWLPEHYRSTRPDPDGTQA